jgi:hypothetical protein
MLRDNHTDPNVPQQWEPPTVSALSCTVALAGGTCITSVFLRPSDGS